MTVKLALCWIGFTPDEEVGSGADLFDLDYFKAKFAYTVDGDYEGEVAYENFNAASASFEIKGVNVHPGEAKDIMIKAGEVRTPYPGRTNRKYLFAPAPLRDF